MDDISKKEEKKSESTEELQKIPSALTDEELGTVAGGKPGGPDGDSDTYPCKC
jgi:hypothetical protein